jgi:hypothetical protein
VALFSSEQAQALVFSPGQSVVTLFSSEQAQALVFSPGRSVVTLFSPEQGQALVFSLSSPQAPEHAVAELQTELQAERLAEPVLFVVRMAAPERAGAGLRAARVPGEAPFSLGREEIWPVAAAVRVWTPLDPAFSRARLARTLLCLRRPPMTTV